jgi:hypothetical protein
MAMVLVFSHQVLHNKTAQQSVHLTAYGAGTVGIFVRDVTSIIMKVAKPGGK